jgi:hypothetical protein
MTKRILGVSLVLLVGLLGWSLRGTPGGSDLDRALRASALRADLIEAQISLVSARMDLYERDFRSAGRQLEHARDLLRRSAERGKRLGGQDEVERLDLVSFEADIDKARRLLGQLEQGDETRLPEGRDLLERLRAMWPREDSFAVTSIRPAP